MKVTPYRLRKAKAVMAECLESYRKTRLKALEVKAQNRGDSSNRAYMAREDAVAEALHARDWYWAERRKVEAMVPVTGYSWSDNALERVRNANRKPR